MDRHQKKLVQAMNYLSNKNGNQINRLKLIKLLWIADKYHLLMHRRTILKDVYFAAPHGPIASETLDISKNCESTDYSSEFLESTNFSIKSRKEPDLNFFSESDIEVLDLVWKEFSMKNQWELRDLTHEYPEWKKFEKDLNDSSKPNRYKMNIEDFFNLPEHTEINNSNFFRNISENNILESIETSKLRKKIES